MSSNAYNTQVQWGGNSAPWHDNGMFVIGGRDNQRAVGLWASSSDGGKSFTGEMQYGKSERWPSGEGKIGFKATQTVGNTYSTQVQWGGTSAPWHDNGNFIIGARDGQRCVSIQIASSDDGNSFSCQMTYAGEGPIGFKATTT